MRPVLTLLRRILRITGRLARALSALLLLAVVVLWVRSSKTCDTLSVEKMTGARSNVLLSTSLLSFRGRFVYIRITCVYTDNAGQPKSPGRVPIYHSYASSTIRPNAAAAFLPGGLPMPWHGLAVVRRQQQDTFPATGDRYHAEYSCITLPHALFVLLLALYPAIHLARNGQWYCAKDTWRRILRGFPRAAYSALAGASMLLFVATALLWARSYWRFDSISRLTWRYLPTQTPGEYCPVQIRDQWCSGNGEVGYICNQFAGYAATTERRDDGVHYGFTSSDETDLKPSDYAPPKIRFELLGLKVTHDPRPTPVAGMATRLTGWMQSWALIIPHWMLLPLTALVPAIWLVGRLRRRRTETRRARGFCPNCGYDLRATPDPAGPRLPRCPECGREVVLNQH